MAKGIEGLPDAEEAGGHMLDAVCDEIVEAAKDLSYFHRWEPTDMVIWDNWRVLHSVSGMAPEHARCMHRTTIKGDYGLGRFEAALPAEPRGTFAGRVKRPVSAGFVRSAKLATSLTGSSIEMFPCCARAGRAAFISAVARCWPMQPRGPSPNGRRDRGCLGAGVLCWEGSNCNGSDHA